LKFEQALDKGDRFQRVATLRRVLKK